VFLMVRCIGEDLVGLSLQFIVVVFCDLKALLTLCFTLVIVKVDGTLNIVLVCFDISTFHTSTLICQHLLRLIEEHSSKVNTYTSKTNVISKKN
jgi:hypothetical protein